MHRRSRITLALAALALLLVPTLAFAAHATARHHAKTMAVGVRVLQPASGAVIHTNVVRVRSVFTNWKVACAWAGKANKSGVGHYHVLLDGALVNMYCGNTAWVSLQNIKPGKHMLTVIPAENDHSDMMFMQKKEMRQISFTYRPSHPLATITNANLGKPSIAITSPANGSTVHGAFPLNIRVRNFHLSCALYGKQNLKGWGHWHINHDAMNGPMMGMGTMLGMSCAKSFRVSTVGLKPGKHTFFAILEDNQHAPLMPSVFGKVTVTVK